MMDRGTKLPIRTDYFIKKYLRWQNRLHKKESELIELKDRLDQRLKIKKQKKITKTSSIIKNNRKKIRDLKKDITKVRSLYNRIEQIEYNILLDLRKLNIYNCIVFLDHISKTTPKLNPYYDPYFSGTSHSDGEMFLGETKIEADELVFKVNSKTPEEFKLTQKILLSYDFKSYCFEENKSTTFEDNVTKLLIEFYIFEPIYMKWEKIEK